jgi:hypothetical protein
MQLPHKRHRQRILERLHGRLHLPPHLGGQRHGTVDEHQPGDTVGMGLCHPTGDKAAGRMPDQGRALDLDGVQKDHDIGGEVVDAIAAGRALRVAVAALVQGVGVVARGQQRKDPLNENHESAGGWMRTIGSLPGSPCSA